MPPAANGCKARSSEDLSSNELDEIQNHPFVLVGLSYAWIKALRTEHVPAVERAPVVAAAPRPPAVGPGTFEPEA